MVTFLVIVARRFEPRKPIARTLSEAEASRAAIAAVHRLGGDIEYNVTTFKITLINLNSTSANDRDIRFIRDLVGLRVLKLGDTRLTDDGMVYLTSLKQLKNLNLAYTSVSEKGLDMVASCRELEVLYLNGTVVTDKGIGRLSE